jgi:subtilisin family serine protease
LVVPLGYVVKGDDCPVVTAGPGAAPPAGAPAAVRVAMIDTGIPAQPRGDGWLAGVSVPPAAFDGVVAVGALTDDLRPAPFSNHGSWVRCSAVGVGVVSTFVTGIEPPEPQADQPDQVFGADSWALWSGTSFSAPQISGAVARLCGEEPGRTPRAALDALLAGQPELPGYGRTVRLLPGTLTA